MRAATTCSGTPSVNASVVCVWRRMCRLPLGIFAAFRRDLKPSDLLRVDRQALGWEER
jgi:hypothetical protein